MASLEAIDVLYRESSALTEHLARVGEPSLQVLFENQFRKALLLSAASRFETEVKDAVLAFAIEKSGGDEQLIALVTAKAIERQYHTYFNWDASNANQFFGLFGANFKEFMKSVLASDKPMADSIGAFIELGALRNQLVHMDFATFPLEKTPAEIYELYQRAAPFVTNLPQLLRRQL